MSDYSTPQITDASVSRLASSITDFAEDVRDKIINLDANIYEVLSKQYTVNHEPKIDLTFENEYKYIHDSLDQTYKKRGGLDKLTHIFISGYLPNGKTIRHNYLEEDEQGHTVMKHFAAHINGNSLIEDYTCRAEEGSRDKINILIVQAPSETSPTKIDGRLDIDYSDFPLEDFKMIVYDDVENPIYPNIDSFLESRNIDTLKVIGNFRWTSSILCTLRRLEVTQELAVTGTMNCPCLQELIIPNATSVPLLHNQAKSSIVKLDISKVKNIQNLDGIQIDDDLNLDCSALTGMKNSKIRKVRIGNSCTSISDSTFSSSTISEFYGGVSLVLVGASGFFSCSQLEKVVFNNINVLNFSYNAFNGCKNLKSVSFGTGGIGKIDANIFSGCTSLQDLNFQAPITMLLNFSATNVLTEQSCLDIINNIKVESKVSVSLSQAVKNHMSNDWYCKLQNDKYVSCTADDEGAIKQESALITKGGTLQ